MSGSQTHPPRGGNPTPIAGVDGAHRLRLEALCTEGWAISDQLLEIRQNRFHPFIAGNYERVLETLARYRAPGLRFLEWGSATGVITIMADLLGFEAYGIELDSSLVATARGLAERHRSNAKFAAGSLIPEGYRWRPSDGDGRTGTLGTGPSGYLILGLPLDDFDLVFGYPWGGEEPMMLDLMQTHGRPDALLLLHGLDDQIRAYRGGHDLVPLP